VWLSTEEGPILLTNLTCLFSRYYIELNASGDLPTDPTAYLPFRNMATETSQKHFFTLFDSMMECVSGKKVWTPKEKVRQRISPSGKVSITDEAFIVLCLENYWEKWKSMSAGAVSTTDGANIATGTLTRWTDARRGHCQFGGWEAEGLHRFNALCHKSRDSRLADTCYDAEAAYQQYAIGLYGAYGEKGSKFSGGSKAPRDSVEVFDDFDCQPPSNETELVVSGVVPDVNSSFAA
jgi:hypothetical protein